MSKVKTRVLLEKICFDAASFSEPHLPTEFAFIRHALLAQFKKLEASKNFVFSNHMNLLSDFSP
jgi:hypothetical protein